MKVARSGGQEQGTLTTTPASLVMPSQSPVPVGLRPAACPNSGTRATSTLTAVGAGAVDIGAVGEVAGAGAAVPS